MQNRHQLFFLVFGVLTFGEGGRGQANWDKIPSNPEFFFYRQYSLTDTSAWKIQIHLLGSKCIFRLGSKCIARSSQPAIAGVKTSEGSPRQSGSEEWGQKSQSMSHWNLLLWDSNSNGVCEIGESPMETQFEFGLWNDSILSKSFSQSKTQRKGCKKEREKSGYCFFRPTSKMDIVWWLLFNQVYLKRHTIVVFPPYIAMFFQ